MTTLTSLILVVSIIGMSAGIAYYLQRGQPLMKDIIEIEKEVEPVIEEIERIAEDLTNEVIKDEKAIQTAVQEEAVKVIKALSKTSHLDEKVGTTPATPKKRKYYPKSPKGKA